MYRKRRTIYILVLSGLVAALLTFPVCCTNGTPDTTSPPGSTGATQAVTTTNSYILDNPDYINTINEEPAQVFYSGHGWEKILGTGTFSEDTDDFVKGDRSLKLVTTGDTKGNNLRKTGTEAIDYTSRYPIIRLKVNDVNNLSSLYFTMSSSDYSRGYYSWSIKNQLQLNASYNHDDEWITLSLSFSQASRFDECTRNTINSYELKCTDSGRPVTVRLGSIGFNHQPPEGIVSLTFDDGWLSQYTEAKRKMDEYGFSGTIYVIKEKIGAKNYVTLKQLKELQNGSGWSISCHGGNSYTEMTAMQLDDFFRDIKGYLAKNGLTSGMDDVSYPNGSADKKVFEKTRKYFRSGRTITEFPEYYPPVNPYSLRIKNITKNTPISEVDAAVAGAIKEKEWLILCFHKIVPSPSATTEYSVKDFGSIIDKIYNSGIKVRNVAEVLSGEGLK